MPRGRRPAARSAMVVAGIAALVAATFLPVLRISVDERVVTSLDRTGWDEHGAALLALAAFAALMLAALARGDGGIAAAVAIALCGLAVIVIVASPTCPSRAPGRRRARRPARSARAGRLRESPAACCCWPAAAGWRSAAAADRAGRRSRPGGLDAAPDGRRGRARLVAQRGRGPATGAHGSREHAEPRRSAATPVGGIARRRNASASRWRSACALPRRRTATCAEQVDGDAAEQRERRHRLQRVLRVLQHLVQAERREHDPGDEREVEVASRRRERARSARARRARAPAATRWRSRRRRSRATRARRRGRSRAPRSPSRRASARGRRPRRGRRSTRPSAMITTSPWRSAKCAGASFQPSARKKYGPPMSASRASDQSTACQAPPSTAPASSSTTPIAVLAASASTERRSVGPRGWRDRTARHARRARARRRVRTRPRLSPNDCGTLSAAISMPAIAASMTSAPRPPRVDDARQPGVRGPRPPQQRQHDHRLRDPLPGRALDHQRRALRQRKHEHEVEEELQRRHPLALPHDRGQPVLRGFRLRRHPRASCRPRRATAVRAERHAALLRRGGQDRDVAAREMRNGQPPRRDDQRQAAEQRKPQQPKRGADADEQHAQQHQPGDPQPRRAIRARRIGQHAVTVTRSRRRRSTRAAVSSAADRRRLAADAASGRASRAQRAAAVGSRRWRRQARTQPKPIAPLSVRRGRSRGDQRGETAADGAAGARYQR